MLTIPFQVTARLVVLFMVACYWNGPAIAENGKLSAKLPNGITVELAGVTKNTAPAQSGWRPDGGKIDTVAKWPIGRTISGNITISGANPRYPPEDTARDLLIGLSGVKRPVSVSLPDHFDSFDLPQNAEVMRFRACSKNDAKLRDAELLLTDEPWGKSLKIAPGGDFLNEITRNDPHWICYRFLRIVKLGEADSYLMRTNRPNVMMLLSREALKRFVVEVRAIDKQGKAQGVSTSTGSSADSPYVRFCWEPDSRLKDADFSHFEFRLRPYRYLVSFQNISMHAGHTTTPKITMKTLEDPQPEGRTVVNKKLITWLRALADGTPDEKGQAAVDIADWAADTQPDSVDPRLIKALIRRMDLSHTTFPKSRNGPNPGRPVGTWCQSALNKIGRPAVPELLAIVKAIDDEPPAIRNRALNCLEEIKRIGPDGVDTLLALIDNSKSDISGPAFNVLQHVTAEPSLLPKLIAQSERGSVMKRRQVIYLLGRFPGEDIDNLLKKTLSAPERDLRLTAMGTIQNTPRPQLAPTLVALLKDDDPFIRNTLASTLWRMADRSMDALMTGLQSENSRIREGCILAVTQASVAMVTRAAPLLTKALRDPAPEVRVQAMGALTRHPRQFDRRVLIEALLENLQHNDAKVRSTAASSILYCSHYSINDRRFIPPLLQALEDSDPETLRNAISAIAIYRESRAVPALIRLAEKSPSVRRAALDSLGTINDPRAIPVARKFAAESDPAALCLLGKLGDRDSIPLLIAALANPKRDVQTAAADALQYLPDPRAVPPLIIELNQYSSFNRGQDGTNYMHKLSRALAANADGMSVSALISKIDSLSRLEHSGRFREERRPTSWNDPMYDVEIQSHPLLSPLSQASELAFPEIAKGLASQSVLTRKICAYILSNNFSDSPEFRDPDHREYRANLLAAFKDPDDRVRVLAIRAAGRQRIPEAEPLLLAMLEGPMPPRTTEKVDPSSYTSAGAVQAEAAIAASYFRNERIGRALVRLLNHGEFYVRAAAADHLGPFNRKITVPPLLLALEDDPHVAINAARVLGHIGDPVAILPLMGLLKNHQNDVLRSRAAQSLGLLGATDARPLLRDVLRQTPIGDKGSPKFELQLSVAISLMQLQDMAGTERLRELFAHQDSDVRSTTLYAVHNAHYFSKHRPIARLSHEPSRAMLRQYAEQGADPPEQRGLMLDVLGDPPDPVTQALLEKSAADPKSDFHWRSIQLLASLNPPAFEEQLLKALDDPENRIRNQIITLIARIPGEQVTQRLLALTMDRRDDVRLTAVTSLERRDGAAVNKRLQELVSEPAPRVRHIAQRVLSARQAAKGK